MNPSSAFKRIGNLCDTRFPGIAACLLLLAGCASTPTERIQVQFYSPDGAAIALRGAGADGAQSVRSRGPLGNRLETQKSDLAVFDLSPGRYEFAYACAAGAEDAVIYGDLELCTPKGRAAELFVRNTFVPIKLPSVRAQIAEHRFPMRDLSYTVGLEHREFQHLEQGDLLTRVYFVADLAGIKHDVDNRYPAMIGSIDRELAVLDDQQTYLNKRYADARREALQRSPDMNIEDKIAHERFDLFGMQEPFVKIARKRQEAEAFRASLLRERSRLESERARRSALLRSLAIVHRDGALVLATPDLQLPYQNAVAQAEELGEVVAVMRVGGRHRHWASRMLADAGGEYPANVDPMVDSERPSDTH